jgi:hypothetical protein
VPSLIIHLLIPTLVALALHRWPTRLVLLMMPLAEFADLDFFLAPHRALAHNLFIPVIAGLAWWQLRAQGSQHADAALLATFLLASHPLMDLFAGGVALFWPLWDQTFFLDVQILIDTRTLQPIPTFQPGAEQGVPQVADVYEFLDGVQAAILVLTLAIAGIAAVRRARMVKREIVVTGPEVRR